jgi:sialic acid synthase SpsE
MQIKNGVIAEIGNCHGGSVEKAKEMIRVARECGAVAAKFQAIDPREVTGSMPLSFYEHVSLTFEEYAELRIYGEELHFPVFFSIFGEKYDYLLRMFPTMPLKVSGGQFRTWAPEDLARVNNSRTFCSIPELPLAGLVTKTPHVSNMRLFYVGEYLPQKPNLEPIAVYLDWFRKHIAYSDHNIGVDVCKMAIAQYGCNLIEKHFFLGEEIKWDGQVFRDCIHSANPKQLEDLVLFHEEEFS